MFRFLTAGESHGPGLTIMVEGLPASINVSEEDIEIDLQRRQKGFGRGGRMKIEKDHAYFKSGVRHGLTLGSPISLWIENIDFRCSRNDFWYSRIENIDFWCSGDRKY